jgi:hypothetical protein
MITKDLTPFYPDPVLSPEELFGECNKSDLLMIDPANNPSPPSCVAPPTSATSVASTMQGEWHDIGTPEQLTAD